MLDISPDKILVVLLVALVVLGPGRLVEAARTLGKLRVQWRQLSSEVSPDIPTVIRNPRGTLVDALAEPRRAVTDVATSARQAMTPTTEPESGEGTQ
jgi:Sec-independent protein translocase protein TatA